MKLKVCGMKYNTADVATLQPEYLGFIFYDKSPRNFVGEIPQLPEGIKKVGVFVDEKLEEVVEKVTKHQLNAVQLHGKESPGYCNELRELHSKLISESYNANLNHHPNIGQEVQIEKTLEIIKVFSIKDEFNFEILEPYEEVVNFYLFDTKGQLPGGNGYAFDWGVLQNYPSKKPFFLSGGIGLEEVEKLNSFLRSEAAKYCCTIDVNSRFEIEPGLKKITSIKEIKHRIIRKSDFIAILYYDGERKTAAKDGYRPHIEFKDIDFRTSGSQYFLNDQGKMLPNKSEKAFISIASPDFFIKKLFRNMSFKFYEGRNYIGRGEILEIINKSLEI